MLEQLSPHTLVASRHTAKRLGTFKHALAFGACDIGQAVIDGKIQTITWGRNLNKTQQEFYRRYTYYIPVCIGADDGSSELIIPENEANFLLENLT
jgi:hypothetical protein